MNIFSNSKDVKELQKKLEKINLGNWSIVLPHMLNKDIEPKNIITNTFELINKTTTQN